MPVPRLIPIAHEPGHRADTIGRYDDGLFLASAWDHHAYVHLFDHDGMVAWHRRLTALLRTAAADPRRSLADFADTFGANNE